MSKIARFITKIFSAIFKKRVFTIADIIAAISLTVVTALTVFDINSNNISNIEDDNLILAVNNKVDILVSDRYPNSTLQVKQDDIKIEDVSIEEIKEPEYSLTQEEIELIALVTMAEAEGEPEEGKRLVIDTILNRVDGKYWPNTVSEVIYQKNQFTSMWNGRVDRCYVREDIVELVKEELISRTDYDVVFFRTTRYSDYGVPKFQVGHHYFSSYD